MNHFGGSFLFYKVYKKICSMLPPVIALIIKYHCEDFVVNCTLPVNASACLSQRRVNTRVFTNQACAVNRNRSKIFITRAILEAACCRFFHFKKEKSHQNGGSK